MNKDWDRDHWVRFGSISPWQWGAGFSLWLGGGWSGHEWIWAFGVGILVAGVGWSGYRRTQQVPIGAQNWREAIGETYTHLRFPRGTRWLLSPYRESGDSGWKPNWYVVALRWIRGWKFVPHDREPNA